MNKYCFFLGIISFNILLIGCNKSPSSSGSNHNIQYVETILDGCHLGYSEYLVQPKTNTLSSDTVIVNTLGDTTNISVNLYYICAWRFTSDHYFDADTLFLEINDACISDTSRCGAYCYCDYIFIYRFINISGKNIKYKAYFDTPRQGDSKIIGTGVIE